MAFADHIRRCNNYDPARVVPFFAGVDRIGLVRRDNARLLASFPEVFRVADDRVELTAPGDAAARSRAVERVVEELVGEGRIPKTRSETFDVACKAIEGRKGRGAAG